MYPMPTRIAAVAGLCILGACSSAPEAQTPEQKRYLAEAGSFPLDFSIRRTELDTAIDRAHEWLETYSQTNNFSEAAWNTCRRFAARFPCRFSGRIF